jgi:alkylhydroperoxidase family enzyme
MTQAATPAPETSRIAPAMPPYEDGIAKHLDKIMPDGVPPLVLFTTLARNPRVFSRMMSGGLLDKGTLTLRQRELMIDRTTALCGAEYEWGVHMTFFAQRVGLTPGQSRSIVSGLPDDPCWEENDERLILRLADSLHETSGVDDTLWTALGDTFSEEQLIELVVLAGYYHAISFCCRAFNLPLEPYAARFDAV